MQVSKDQKYAIEQLYEWLKQKSPYITLGGYAGVGKTTIMAIFRKLIFKSNPKLRVAFCSFTGRATRVLLNSLKVGDAIYPKDNVSTIHSLIYSPILNTKNKITGWKLKDKLKFDLVIVDEASMVSENIWNDLIGFGIPVLAVGDHGQLPPIEGKFNLMQSPSIRLEKIHRQAEHNPIIQMSMLAREEGFVPAKRYDKGVEKISQGDMDAHDKVDSLLKGFSFETMVLCGYNKTRVSLNKFIRHNLGFEDQIASKGDRVICLKNNQKKHIFNGMLGTISAIKPEVDGWQKAEIAMDDEDNFFEGKIYKDQFGSTGQSFFYDHKLRETGDFFDFGYAMTVHKAQGSQAKRVIVFEERFPKMDEQMWRRWLYTAITRAEEELYLIGN